MEEIFGPVLVCLPFRTAKEAIALANNTMYGLGASVHSEQLPLALETAKHIKSGTVMAGQHREKEDDETFIFIISFGHFRSGSTATICSMPPLASVATSSRVTAETAGRRDSTSTSSPDGRARSSFSPSTWTSRSLPPAIWRTGPTSTEAAHTPCPPNRPLTTPTSCTTAGPRSGPTPPT